jgi:uncharacterized protein with PIN domain
MQSHLTAADDVTHAPFAVASSTADFPGRSSLRRYCPQCNGPLERVPCSKLDRIVSRVIPVHRYACYTEGWGCGWVGILRVKRASLASHGAS